MVSVNKLLQHPSDNLDLASSSPAGQFSGMTLPADAGASVVFDTTGQSTAGEGPLNSALFGQSFTTGGTGANLSDLKLDLIIDNPGDGGSFTVELWSDGGGTSGPAANLATLATLDDSQFSTGLTLQDVPLSSNPALAANTRYWIVLQGSATTSANWGATNDFSGTEASTELNDIVGDTRSDTNDGLVLQMAVTTDTCFAAGTRILSAAGEVPVESLRPGDQVVALRRGGLATVRWVGVRPVNLRRHPNRERLDPVRIEKDAFAPGIPHRDLFVSPDHALYIDGALISVRYLLNGATIAQIRPDAITYYHVELDRHDVLLAENLAAESFLDVGNRSAFANGGKAIMVHPEFGRDVWDTQACAPCLVTHEQRAPIRDRLRARIPELGYAATDDADLRIEAGATIHRPTITGNIAHATLPPGTESIRLLSRTACPKYLGPEQADGRQLGIGVRRLMLDGREVKLDHPDLLAGWHAPEADIRWTQGAAILRTAGAATLTIHLHPGLTYWLPAKPERLSKADGITGRIPDFRICATI